MYQVFYYIAGRASAADRDQVKHDLYDMFNQGASAFLEAWIPDNLHPDSLTAEAILKAENELLAEKAAALPLDIQMQDLAADIKKEMEKDGLIPKAAAISEDNLIPFNSLDENGKPRKPVHKQ
jgi:uncharacterized alpha/beta hydrolase family protein